MVTEEIEKVDQAAEAALLNLSGIPSLRTTNNGLGGGSVMEIGRRWLAARKDAPDGVQNASRLEVAEYLIGRGGRCSRWDRRNSRSANVSSGHFGTYVLANAMEKAVYGGFNADQQTTYQLWVKERPVMDFKPFYGGALDHGNLVQTAENTPFPELLKEEGGYSSALNMWGAQISLTFQAIVNDDLGQFMAQVGRAGYIAKHTIDKQVYYAIENATWTSRTTAGNLSDTQLDVVRANMAGIAGPAGEVLGLIPRFLIVPVGLRSKALQISQIAPYIAPTEVKAHTDLIPIVTPYLTTKTTAANSKWYIATETMMDPVVLATLQGVDSPIVDEFDPGAVAAKRWKIYMPFKPVVPTVENLVQGLWQGSGT